MIEMKKTVFKMRVYGEEFELRKPTILESENVSEDFSKAKKDGSKVIALQKKFFVMLGMPEAVADNLEIEHATDVLELLLPKKKDSVTPS